MFDTSDISLDRTIVCLSVKRGIIIIIINPKLNINAEVTAQI